MSSVSLPPSSQPRQPQPAQPERREVVVDGVAVELVEAVDVVVGTGAAGYCAADRLAAAGRQVLMVTDKRRAGASRNAGSDKQTYYKMTLSGSSPDSVREMAQTLFAGGAMDGDVALAEAAWSARAFFHLVESGVPFPHNADGEYVGYKTDHDPRQRATSVGPYTSRTMVERLEERVLGRHRVPVLDAVRVVDLVVDRGRVVGLLGVRLDERSAPGRRFVLVRCANLVYATGGPAGIYADSVYPHGQWGANGAALRAGAQGKNLTEWQFGLASIHPRWNVSGTYMQAMPRFVSTDSRGGDEREFLLDYLPDYGDHLARIFLKGYQWPFDVRKATGGSSLVDLLVYQETVLKGRRVFLDFRRNPGAEAFDADALTQEVRDYLDATGTLELGNSTPIQRLQQMNRPAYEFYLNRNPAWDLEKDMLEVAVCAQHNNGGLEVDHWWRSTLEGFFPVGEAAGAHGVYRPGGAALNSGQVGATRAATWIATRGESELPGLELVQRAAGGLLRRADELLHSAGERAEQQGDSTEELLTAARADMSRLAGVVRSRESVRQALDQVVRWRTDFEHTIAADTSSRRSVSRLFLLRDILDTQYVYLSAMLDYLAHGGHSRGSVLYTDPGGSLPRLDEQAGGSLAELFSFRPGGSQFDDVVQLAHWDGSAELAFSWRPVRPVPQESAEAFELVWQRYRENRNVD